MSFHWSLNPYMGCAHRCTFCFVRAFEGLADRPSDARYGTSIRVKSNLVEVLRARARPAVVEARAGRRRDGHRLYQPAEGRFRLTRGAIEALGDARTPIGLITRGPLIVRDVDVLAVRRRARRGRRHVLDPDPRPEIWRLTEPGTAPPSQRLRALRTLVDAGLDASVGDGPDPARAVGRSGQDGRRRPGRARRRRDLDLDQRAVPAAGRPRALPGQPGPRLAGAPADVRAALRRPCLRRRRMSSSPSGSACATWPGSTALRTGGGARSNRRPPISSPASSSPWRSRTGSGSG